MPSFILRNLDPEFWSRVQAKATAEGTTVKAVILRLLASWLGVLVLFSLVGCAYQNPTAPAPPPPATPGLVSRIELASTPGMGTQGGTGLITARAYDAYATALADQVVTFATSGGTLTAADVLTDASGFARTTISGPESVVTITAAIGSIASSTKLAIQAPPPPPPTPSTPTPPTPTPTPPNPTPPNPQPPNPTPIPPTPLFTKSGTGNDVFDMPTTVARVRIVGTYTGFGSNFIVRIGGALVVNVILGTSSNAIGTTTDGTYLTSGGTVSITNSDGVAWTFTEVR